VIFVLFPTDGAPSCPLQTQREDKLVSEGAIDTDPIHFNDGRNEGKREVDVDPYALPASSDIQQKP
jgi:hypothetical protein